MDRFLTECSESMERARTALETALAKVDSNMLNRDGGAAWAEVLGAKREAERADITPVAGRKAYEVALAILPEALKQAASLRQSQQQAEVASLAVAIKEKQLFIDLGAGVKMELVWIAPGEFMMGSPANQADRSGDESQRRVRISKGFWMGKYEVTQAQWEKVMGNNPSSYKNAGAKAPVESVSWNDCQTFLERLYGRLQGGLRARLPTEAEWEYACRAGTTTRFTTGDNDTDLDRVGWYESDSGGTTHPVGQKQANAWGLYDMHGNVWEWCRDWYGTYDSGAATDPTGPSSGSGRVLRGGSWFTNVGFCRSAARSCHDPAVTSFNRGFRVVIMSGVMVAPTNAPSVSGVVGSAQPVAAKAETAPASKSAQDIGKTLAPAAAVKPLGSEAEQKRKESQVGSTVSPQAGQPLSMDLGGGVQMDMVWIPPGEVMMGSPAGEAGRFDNETQQRVRINKGFWMGKYEVTQEQWKKIMGNNPSRFTGSLNPVDQVSWNDCQNFLAKMYSAFRRQNAGVGQVRLPTEAEWEYACRAGTKTQFNTGDGDADLDRAGWYGANSGNMTHPVGQKQANAWGLYDMHGNVWEWCQDRYGADEGGAGTDPTGSSSGPARMLRGGSWSRSARDCRSAYRLNVIPTGTRGSDGFRVVVIR
ncbi:MAG: formylglycine-generating enzyme family protein [bacterium]